MATASSSGSSAAAATAAPAADLVSWVQDAGGSTAGIVVQRGESGFGLAAAQDCAPGTTLLALPQRCHLTYDGSTDPRLLALIEQVPAELWGAKLALQARGAAGPAMQRPQEAFDLCLFPSPILPAADCHAAPSPFPVQPSSKARHAGAWLLCQ